MSWAALIVIKTLEKMQLVEIMPNHFVNTDHISEARYLPAEENPPEKIPEGSHFGYREAQRDDPRSSLWITFSTGKDIHLTGEEADVAYTKLIGRPPSKNRLGRGR
jgi:hypothetical protein